MNSEVYLIFSVLIPPKVGLSSKICNSDHNFILFMIVTPYIL